MAKSKRRLSCMASLVCLILDTAAWDVLNSTLNLERMTGSGRDRLGRPGNLFEVLLLLETTQLAVTALHEGWSPVSLPEQQSSCPAPQFDVAGLRPDRTSCSESGRQHREQ